MTAQAHGMKHPTSDARDTSASLSSPTSPRRPWTSMRRQDSADKRACEQCRHRKVRCTATQPEICDPCRRLKFNCSFNANRSVERPKQQPHKIRGTVACYYCRAQKIKCSSSLPQCATCSQKGRICVYPAGGRSTRHEYTGSSGTLNVPQSSPTFAVSEDQASASSILSPPEAVSGALGSLRNSHLLGPPTTTYDIVELFIKHIYPVPAFSFIHPGSIRTQLANGNLDQCLTNAISALTAILLFREYPVSHSMHLISASEATIWEHLEQPTLPRIQALLLCVACHMETGRFQRAFMLAGLAARGATAIRLNYEGQSEDGALQESRRRTVWSLKLLESYFSIGLPENELLPFENVYLQLPLREDQFQESAPITVSEGGAYHSVVRLVAIRRDIVKLNRSMALYDQPFPQLLEIIGDIERDLNRSSEELQQHDSEDNEDTGRLDPWLARKLIAKLSWHQCHCDLYRLLLPGYPEAAPAIVLSGMSKEVVQHAVECCLRHAIAIVQRMSAMNSEHTQTCLLEFDTAICGYHATRLILFLGRSSLCEGQLSREYALSRAELCLAAMNRFFRLSALAKPVLIEMQSMIQDYSGDSNAGLPHAAGPTANSQDSPVHQDAIRVRQRLAVHSLLRQAEFDGSSPDTEHG